MPVEQIKTVNTVSREALEEVGYLAQMLQDHPNLANIVNDFLINHEEDTVDMLLVDEFIEDVQPDVDRIVVIDQ